MGLMNGGECYCKTRVASATHNQYDQPLNLDVDQYCAEPCTGAASQTCGGPPGSLNNLVFELESKPTTTTTTTTTLNNVMACDESELLKLHDAVGTLVVQDRRNETSILWNAKWSAARLSCGANVSGGGTCSERGSGFLLPKDMLAQSTVGMRMNSVPIGHVVSKCCGGSHIPSNWIASSAKLFHIGTKGRYEAVLPNGGGGGGGHKCVHTTSNNPSGKITTFPLIINNNSPPDSWFFAPGSYSCNNVCTTAGRTCEAAPTATVDSEARFKYVASIIRSFDDQAIEQPSGQTTLNVCNNYNPSDHMAMPGKYLGGHHCQYRKKGFGPSSCHNSHVNDARMCCCLSSDSGRPASLACAPEYMPAHGNIANVAGRFLDAGSDECEEACDKDSECLGYTVVREPGIPPYCALMNGQKSDATFARDASEWEAETSATEWCFRKKPVVLAPDHVEKISKTCNGTAAGVPEESGSRLCPCSLVGDTRNYVTGDRSLTEFSSESEKIQQNTVLSWWVGDGNSCDEICGGVSILGDPYAVCDEEELKKLHSAARRWLSKSELMPKFRLAGVACTSFDEICEGNRYLSGDHFRGGDCLKAGGPLVIHDEEHDSLGIHDESLKVAGMNFMKCYHSFSVAGCDVRPTKTRGQNVHRRLCPCKIQHSRLIWKLAEPPDATGWVMSCSEVCLAMREEDIPVPITSTTTTTTRPSYTSRPTTTRPSYTSPEENRAFSSNITLPKGGTTTTTTAPPLFEQLSKMSVSISLILFDKTQTQKQAIGNGLALGMHTAACQGVMDLFGGSIMQCMRGESSLPTTSSGNDTSFPVDASLDLGIDEKLLVGDTQPVYPYENTVGASDDRRSLSEESTSSPSSSTLTVTMPNIDLTALMGAAGMSGMDLSSAVDRYTGMGVVKLGRGRWVFSIVKN